MIDGRCPLCGTTGKVWHEQPAVFVCPNCSSVFSNFGFVLEAEKEFPEMWN